jgi:hypothetical protein
VGIVGSRLADVRYKARTIPQPAAGAEVSFTCPGEVRLLVMSLAFRLVTSAIVANRATSLYMDAEGITVFTSVAGVVQAASADVELGAFAGSVRNGSAGGNALIGLPTYGLPMYPGWVLRTATDNIDPADQYSAVGLLAIEYETGPFASGEPIPPFYVGALDPAYAG